MKLRYHIDREKDGIVVLEAEPQLRSIFIKSEVKNTIRVPFPYIIFTIRYNKLSSGRFSFPSVYRSGFHVYGKLSPLTHHTDDVFLLPTDMNDIGLVCMYHLYDNKKFSSLKNLVDFVITAWWGQKHTLGKNPFDEPWNKINLNQISEGNWIGVGAFNEVLSKPKVLGRHKLFLDIFPEDIKILDENWPTKLTVSKRDDDK